MSLFLKLKSFFKKKDGYVLVSAVFVFLLVSIVMTGVVSVSVLTNQTTEMRYNYQQAYYTAKSAVSSVTKYIIDNSSDESVLKNLIGKPGKGTVENMGEYTVYVSYVDNSKLLVTAEANFNGQEATAYAYLIKPPAGQGIAPTDNVLYLTGSADGGIGQTELYGNVFVDGKLTFGQGSSIHGFVITTDDTYIDGAANSTIGLFSYGDVTIAAGGMIKGDIFVKGNLNISGGVVISNNAFADGNLNMTNGTISQNATIGGNSLFDGGAKINGKLYHSGSITTGHSNVNKFVAGGAEKLASYSPIDAADYKPATLPIISAPTISENPMLYHPVTINNKKISNSGSITAATVSQISSYGWNATLTIDTSKQDISLLINNTAFSVGQNLKIEVTGPNNVFIYMTGSSSMSFVGGSKFKSADGSVPPKAFIFGDNQSIYLNGTAVHAYVYIPNGSMEATNYSSEQYIFTGSCIVKKAVIQSNVKFLYSEPNLTGTPLDIFKSETSSGGGASATETLWQVGTVG